MKLCGLLDSNPHGLLLPCKEPQADREMWPEKMKQMWIYINETFSLRIDGIICYDDEMIPMPTSNQFWLNQHNWKVNLLAIFRIYPGAEQFLDGLGVLFLKLPFFQMRSHLNGWNLFRELFPLIFFIAYCRACFSFCVTQNENGPNNNRKTFAIQLSQPITYIFLPDNPVELKPKKEQNKK